MFETQAPLGGVTVGLMILFGLSGFYAVLGNALLFLTMKRKGSRLPFVMGSLAVVAYFREAPPVRSKNLDRFALTVALSVPVVIITAILLYPRIWAS